jgi:hypothetical protein
VFDWGIKEKLKRLLQKNKKYYCSK